MKAGPDHVILWADKTHKETTRVGNIELLNDTTWDPHQYKRSTAKIVALPDRLTDDYPIFQDSSGEKFYHDSFPMTARVHDLAVVDWSAIEDTNKIAENLYRVPWGNVYAIIRRGLLFNHDLAPEGKSKVEWVKECHNLPDEDLPEGVTVIDGIPYPASLIPLHAWVFLEPYMGEGIKEIDGVLCRVEGDMVTTANIEPLSTVARVAYIGANVHGREPVLKVGDLACVNTDWAGRIEIDGKEYMTVRQQDIMGQFIL